MRRSEHNKRERYGERAKLMLNAFYWEPEERALMEIMADEFFNIANARDLLWSNVREGIDCVILKEREIAFSPEVLSLFMRGIHERLNFSGEKIASPEEKIFSHETGKNVFRELNSYKGK